MNDYANVEIRVHGTIEKGEYKVQVAKDGNSLMWHRTTHSRSFIKEIFNKIMGGNYRENSACIIAWDNMVLEMCNKGVHRKNGLFWGKPQLLRRSTSTHLSTM
jgi:hypothetical protein